MNELNEYVSEKLFPSPFEMAEKARAKCGLPKHPTEEEQEDFTQSLKADSLLGSRPGTSWYFRHLLMLGEA